MDTAAKPVAAQVERAVAYQVGQVVLAALEPRVARLTAATVAQAEPVADLLLETVATEEYLTAAAQVCRYSDLEWMVAQAARTVMLMAEPVAAALVAAEA